MNESKFSEILKLLKEEFPHGHSGFIPLLMTAMELHSKKNYGYAFQGDPLSNFIRRGKILEQYPDLDDSNPIVVAAKDILKQLDAGLWQLNKKFVVEDETIEARFMDVLVYAGLVILLNRRGDSKTHVVQEDDETPD